MKDYIKFVALLFGVMMLFIAISCMTPQRAERKLQRIYEKQPNVTAYFTRDHFPCITTKEVSDTTYIKGDSMVIEIPCPEANNTAGPVKQHSTTVYVPVKIATGKEVIRKTIFKEDSSKIFLANNITNATIGKLVQAHIENEQLKHNRDHWRKYCLISSGIVLLVIILCTISFSKYLATFKIF